MTRAELHSLIDRLPEEAVESVGDLIENALGSPIRPNPLMAIHAAAPFDDEPLTPEDVREIAKGRASMKRGEGVPWEEVRAELHAAD